MTVHVVGLLFDDNITKIALRQVDGKLDGVRGVVRPGETSMEAIDRACDEAIELTFNQWTQIAVLRLPDAIIHYFAVFAVEITLAENVEFYDMPGAAQRSDLGDRLPLMISIATDPAIQKPVMFNQGGSDDE